MTISSTQRS